jgi:ectoine hydroxylase-related dioxygenase (phytanoyl-CoA dioxygenase family)
VPWHQDTALPLVSHVDSPEWGPWSTKEGVLYAHAPTWALQQIVALRVHLDACHAENGPLRIVAGSHEYGVLTDEQVLAIAHVQPSVECLVGRGGVLLMRPLVIHASSKATGSQPRRVLHLEYAASLELLGLIRLAVA